MERDSLPRDEVMDSKNCQLSLPNCITYLLRIQKRMVVSCFCFDASTIYYHIVGYTLCSEESCKLLSSQLTEVFVTFITSGMHIESLSQNGLIAEWPV